MTRTALITGGTGFVGGSVARLLASSGWRVMAVHRQSTAESALDRLRACGVSTVEFREHTDLERIARDLTPDVLFHLAAHQAKDPPDDVDVFIDTNVTLGTHLLEGLAGSGCVVINAMSYFQFRGTQALPTSLYSATKQAFLVVSRYYSDHRGLDVRNVVLYDNYGPYDPRNKLVSQLVDAARDDSAISIGPANQRINILYVDDVATGLVAASETGNPTVMTVRAPAIVTVGELVGEVERISGRQLRKTIDTSRVPTDLQEVDDNWPMPIGWQPVWDLEKGISVTVQASRVPSA